MSWWRSFADKALKIISAPARLFTGGGIIQKPVEQVFGGQTGSLTPALMDVAKEINVLDKKGNITIDSLAGGLLKAPGAVLNFAEKNAVPALNWAEKNIGDIKAKVEKIPIVGGELGAALGAVEAPLTGVKDILGEATGALKKGEVAVATASQGLTTARETAAAGKQLIEQVKAGKVDEALKGAKETFEKAKKTADIVQMAGNQFGQIPKDLGLVEKPIIDPRRVQNVEQIPVTPINPMNRSRQL